MLKGITSSAATCTRSALSESSGDQSNERGSPIGSLVIALCARRDNEALKGTPVPRPSFAVLKVHADARFPVINRERVEECRFA
jgi:hypothetical protein